MADQYTKFLQKKMKLAKKLSLLDIIKEHEVDLNQITDNGLTLVHMLIIEENREVLDLVLNIPEDFKSKSPNPNLIDKKYGWSPLVLAINQCGQAGFQDLIFSLLRSKADPNLKVDDKTPIQWAASLNQVENVKLLQKYGGDAIWCDQ